MNSVTFNYYTYNSAFSTVHQNTTMFKQLIYITCVNGFVEILLLYYMFRLVEPSSGNTCLQLFSQIIELH
jgi:hypothetical protein